MKRLFLLLMLCTSSWSARAQEQEKVVLPEHQQDLSLVLAEVVDIKRPGFVYSTLRITHVFSQPKGRQMLGKTFEITSGHRGGSGPFTFEPIPNLGEVGLWCVTETPRGVSVKTSAYGAPFPLRQGLDQDETPTMFNVTFAEGAELAGFIERVAANERGHAIQLLKEQLTGSNPAIPSWSVATLAKLLDKEEAQRFLHGALAVTKPHVQITIDQELLRLEDNQWRSSPQRKAMFEGWAGFTPVQRDVFAIYRYLDFNDGIDPDLKCRLLQKIMEREDISADAFMWMAISLSRASRGTEYTAVTFQFLLGKIAQRPELEFKLAAAEGMRHLRLSAEQVARVKTLYDNENEEQLRLAFLTVIGGSGRNGR